MFYKRNHNQRSVCNRDAPTTRVRGGGFIAFKVSHSLPSERNNDAVPSSSVDKARHSEGSTNRGDLFDVVPRVKDLEDALGLMVLDPSLDNRNDLLLESAKEAQVKRLVDVRGVGREVDDLNIVLTAQECDVDGLVGRAVVHQEVRPLSHVPDFFVSR